MSDFLNRMKSAAKADLKTIVLPEGEDPRTIVAATKIIEEGLAKIVILGNPDEINVPGATVIDPRNAEKHEEYAQKFAELRAKKAPATPPPTPCAPRFRSSRPPRAPSWSRPSS